ncbi:peroxisome biogenesis protein 12-like isoform X1 [Panicum virgatum]|uniref:peroxisome biogenesis protein 12-like isoform X1 n=1 Tax=Panicum virgatum TaxID=38727 RepID=UPI0019D595ED|nr:peroxisome biogenesis protein 12-like isoform X1 [Panicum virgatum]
MLFQVGGQGARPTFFEMSAAQQLPASLRAALTYSLGVFALRRPILHKVLDYEDEFFALLMGVLESHSLRTTANPTWMQLLGQEISCSNGSFSESLYGLRRRPVKVSVKRKSPGTESSDKVYDSALRKRQKILSVVFLVVLPYFKSKLQSIYNKEREARLQATLWGQDDVRFDEDGFVLNQEQTSQAQNDPTTGEVSNLTRFKKNFASLIGVCYPWIHATNEGLSFAYQLLYLLDATAFYSPALHVLGLHVCRATGQELMDSSSRISRIRNRELKRLRGPPWLKAVQRVFLSCIYTTLDYAQTGLIAAVFFFKMMEWWYQSAEERMSAPTVYPPPPPPPTPKVAKDGIPLPTDKTLCPLCCQKRANPSVLSVSGFVFCYSCIFKSVSQHKRCPVTLMPATVEQISRLFNDL